ncbi:MAG: hypothetical protein B7X82_01855 [Hydrogenophilales bacterium 17-64-65]|nr:MAG: hypothetical protein B7X82_01855 [Hydrogenophilales bacterium 17-64-65]
MNMRWSLLLLWIGRLPVSDVALGNLGWTTAGWFLIFPKIGRAKSMVNSSHASIMTMVIRTW